MFAMIDGDAHGSMIYQTLVKETKARGARNIEITNLGVFPWKALADGLPHESGLVAQARAKDRYRHSKVADYILERDRHNRRIGNPNNEPVWENWLQDNRIELNAMTSPERVEWVERKFVRHAVQKVIPPVEVANDQLIGKLETEIVAQVRAEALRDKWHWMEEQKAARLAAIKIPEGTARTTGPMQSRS
jgi:hypothetical protein